jgi:prepilin-type processing-associated H-X9-DG protein
MKPNPKSERRKDGGTMIDLIVIVAVVVGAAMIILPMLGRTKCGRSPKIACINNMKQVSTGLRLYANDNDGRYPDALTNIASSAELWKLFQYAQNDISSPRILVCPADTDRFPAADFLTDTNSPTYSDSFAHPSKRNSALSFFYAAGPDEASPRRLLLGDRNLTRDPNRSDQSPGTNFLTGTQRLGSTINEVKDLRWADKIHERGGNMAFMDGSAQQLTSGKLRKAVMNTGDTSNLIWLPQ